MAKYKFNLRDRVSRIGQQEVRTVEERRDNPPGETLYWIQLGKDFTTRVWAKESELQLEEGLDLHVPSIAGSNRVGMAEEEINIPAHERCPACLGTGHSPSTSSMVFPICPACHGSGRKYN